VQLYWNGHFYPAIATAISSRAIRLELHPETLVDPGLLQVEAPPVGLLLGSDYQDPTPTRLVAQVEAVICTDRSLFVAVDQPYSSSGTSLELTFPKQLDVQQRSKIRQLLKTL
jgi:cellulose synthase (UDP-forming)